MNGESTVFGLEVSTVYKISEKERERELNTEVNKSSSLSHDPGSRRFLSSAVSDVPVETSTLRENIERERERHR